MERIFGPEAGIPDARYAERVARQEWAWNHRGEPDPMEEYRKKPTDRLTRAIEDLSTGAPINPSEIEGIMARARWDMEP